MVITKSRAVVMGRVEDLENYDELAATGGSMIDQLMEELEHLGPQVIGDPAWVSGYLAGMQTSDFLMRSEESIAGSYECEDGHTHPLCAVDTVSAYIDAALYGIIEAHLMQASIEEMLDGR